MSENIVLNSSNIVNKNNGNNKLSYSFPRDIKFGKKDQLAISHMNIYYSWFNVSSKYSNNFFQYKWWDNTDLGGTGGRLTTVVDVIIPDGFYSVNTMFEFIQSVMVSNNHYLLTGGGDYVYFVELLTNVTYYSIEWRLSSLNAKYIVDQNLQYPANAGWKAPAISDDFFETAQIIIPSNSNFGTLIGYTGQTITKDTYGITAAGQYSFLNDMPPDMNPSSSFIITCNLISNDLGIPNNILYSFTIPPNISFGDLITSNTDIIYSKIREGSYKTVQLAIYDQNYNLLNIIDPNMLIVLSIVREVEDK
jgi:hypothetical protein